MRRLLAVVAAVLLIVIAVVIRSRLNSGTSNDGKGSTNQTATVVCVTELKKVCDQLHAKQPSVDVRVEEAGTTLATLSAAGFDREKANIDAWLAPAPYTQMVNEARARASLQPVLADPSRTLARSPLVLAIWNDRIDALHKACPGGDVTWKCVGDFAGAPWAEHGGDARWGVLKPGHPPPDKSATGLLVLAQASGQDLGRPDYASNDLDDPAYRAWLQQLEQAVPTFTPSAGTALDQMLFTGPSAFDLAGSIEALAGPSVVASRDKDKLAILYPSPVATADIVLVPLVGSEQGGRVKSVLESNDGAEALAQNGWRVTGQPAAAGVRADQALPDGNGLPKPGVLEALRQTWSEVVR